MVSLSRPRHNGLSTRKSLRFKVPKGHIGIWMHVPRAQSRTLCYNHYNYSDLSLALQQQRLPYKVSFRGYQPCPLRGESISG